MKMTAVGFALGLACWLAFPALAQSPQELKKLVERIAKSDAEDSTDATDEFVEKISGSLAEAIGSFDQRPGRERERIRKAVYRLYAAVDMQLFRADLPETDRKLFDDYVRPRRTVVEQLFSIDEDVRAQALHGLPLEPNSGAGLLLAYQVTTFAEHDAMQIARGFRDPVLSRALLRFVQTMMKRIQTGDYETDEEGLLPVYVAGIERAIDLLGDAGAIDAVPTIIEAVRYFSIQGPRVEDATLSAVVAAIALGKLGDERAAEVLMAHLDEAGFHSSAKTESGRQLTLANGDVVLLSLLRIFKLDPRTLGFIDAPEPKGFLGFPDDSTRQQAKKSFFDWYQKNKPKPAAERGPLTSQPSSEKK